MDDYGHGTHVAGTIAAEDNGFGVVGVAPEASLYALKVLDSNGSGYVSDVIFAIQWATDPDGDGSANDRLDIINMSLGADRGNIFLKWACNLAYSDGLLLVAAAGNSGSVIYPAAYSSVIAVSATDSNDKLAWFSSTGTQVELAAPGVSIYSTYTSTSGYTIMSGTSMASPHVAGTAALVWKANPTWSNNDVRTQLQETAEDLGAVGWDSEFGYGLVNAAEALGVSGEEPLPSETGTMYVENIVMSPETQNRGKNTFVNAVALVTIVDVDDNNNSIEGATVSGTWSGATSDSDSGITNESGQVSFKSDKIKNPKGEKTFTFTVDDVVKDGWTYDSSGQTSNSITLTY